jgi:hypothetical protein
MKKVFLFVLVAVLGVASANAQAYIGGSLGIASGTNKPEGGSKTTSSLFSIAPEVGYSLTEKLDLGISVYFASGKDGDIKTTGFGAAPYVRYSFIELGKFSILGKASLYVEGENEKEGSIKTAISAFGLNVVPVLAYNLSDHFVLLANLGFLGLDLNQSTYKYDGHKTSTGTNFFLGADTNTIATLGDVTIGFAYKF